MKIYVLTYEVNTPGERYSDFISVKKTLEEINDIRTKYIEEDSEIDESSLKITIYEI